MRSNVDQDDVWMLFTKDIQLIHDSYLYFSDYAHVRLGFEYPP